MAPPGGVMNILLASGFQHLPQIFGGVMSNSHEMALALRAAGHQASVAADLLPNDWLGIGTRVLRKLTDERTVHDRFMGYPAYRRWHFLETLPELVEVIKPDVVVAQPSHQIAMSKILLSLGVPVIVYFHDVLFDQLDGDPRDLDGAVFLSNSEFTARRYRERFGIDSTVLPPLFRAERYRTASRGRNVTFINPQPEKGSELALKLAAHCPEIPFCFVESWSLPEEHTVPIREHNARYGNLTLRRRTMDMKSVYRDARILIAPTRIEEAWGRIASEAQFSGIPVIASDRGGLPEAVGPGGVLLNPDGPIEPWVEAVRGLWNDSARYQALSEAALHHSMRSQINSGAQIDTFMKVANAAVQQRRGPTGATAKRPVSPSANRSSGVAV